MSKSIYDLPPDLRSKLYYASSHLSSCGVIADAAITGDCIPIDQAEKYVQDALDAATRLAEVVKIVKELYP